jgi:NADH-quinone oxidoreductase subunit M
MLTLLLLIPLFALFALALSFRKASNWAGGISITAAVIQLMVVVSIAYKVSQTAVSGYMQSTSFYLRESYHWFAINLGQWGIVRVDLDLGLDGFNFPLILLSSIVMLVASISSLSIQRQRLGYHALFLLLSITIYGTFLSLDLLTFYVFFEFMLIPMFFLIGIWGGVRREYAAMKFFLYTLAGSLLILIVFIALFFSSVDNGQTLSGTALLSEGVNSALTQGAQKPTQVLHSFNLTVLQNTAGYISGSVLDPSSGWSIWGTSARVWAFLFLFVGFLIKLPAFPVHTWLPDAHVEAPTPVSVILAGILLKIGGYGLIRIAWPLFPEVALDMSWWVAGIGAVTIVYASFNAMGSRDFKKLIAFSSIAHMGFVLIGLAALNAEAIGGAVYQLFSHGLISALLFLVVGVLYDRTQNRDLSNFRGLATKMPVYSIVATVACFASLGMPGFSGFIAELFVLLGLWGAIITPSTLIPLWVFWLVIIGILLTAAYYVWTLQRLFFGRFSLHRSLEGASMHDLTIRERGMTFFLAALIIVFGIAPALLLHAVSDNLSAWLLLFR